MKSSFWKYTYVLSSVALIMFAYKSLGSNSLPSQKNESDNFSFLKKPHNFYINVDVTSRKLLMIKNNEILFKTDVALAENGFYKVKEGDKKLPIGEYYICETRASNGFHRFLQISYPSIKDADRGLETGLINKEQYNSIVRANNRGVCPPSNTDLGGFIGIHAEHESWSRFYKNDWTFGCVAVDSKVIHKIESKIRSKMRKGKKVPIYIHK